MPTLVIRHADSVSADAARRPRDDVLVGEHEAAPGHFEAHSGVFREWSRTFTEGDDGVIETVRFRTGIPHWGWLIDLVVRPAARRRLAPGARPWWAPAQRIGRGDAATLARCATLSLATGFLGSLLGQTLTFMAKDLGGGVGDQANVLIVVRFGALVTAGAAALADRAGRRRVLGATLAGSGLAGALTAVAPDLSMVAACHLVCRGLAAGSAILLAVVLAEELPAHSRAYGIAVAAAAGGLGAGMVLWALPVIDVAAWAWRPIHLVGLVWAVVSVATVRKLPETRRFERGEHAPPGPAPRVDRVRFAVVSGGLLALSAFTAPTQQLQNDYLRSERGFSATMVTVFLIVTNVGGGVGLVLASRFADRRSRRVTYAVGLVGLAVGNSLMFMLSGPPMWVASAVGSIVGAAVIPSLGALEPELFPTLRRGSTNGAINAIGVAGSVLGLWIVGRTVSGSDYGPTIAVLALGPLLAALSLVALPETAGRELEELNPDDRTQ